MKQLRIPVDPKTYEELKVLVKVLNSRKLDPHLPDLTITSLGSMLMTDAGLAISRPGSWEGVNMGDVLTGHGYQP